MLDPISTQRPNVYECKEIFNEVFETEITDEKLKLEIVRHQSISSQQIKDDLKKLSTIKAPENTTQEQENQDFFTNWNDPKDAIDLDNFLLQAPEMNLDPTIIGQEKADQIRELTSRIDTKREFYGRFLQKLEEELANTHDLENIDLSTISQPSPIFYEQPIKPMFVKIRHLNEVLKKVNRLVRDNADKQRYLSQWFENFINQYPIPASIPSGTTATVSPASTDIASTITLEPSIPAAPELLTESTTTGKSFLGWLYTCFCCADNFK